MPRSQTADQHMAPQGKDIKHRLSLDSKKTIKIKLLAVSSSARWLQTKHSTRNYTTKARTQCETQHQWEQYQKMENNRIIALKQTAVEAIKEWKISYYKIQNNIIYCKFIWNYTICYGQVQVQKGDFIVKNNSLYSTEALWNMSDLPCVKIKIFNIK